MDRGFNAIIHFQVELWKLIFLVGTSLFDITETASINNVADNEPFDGLVFGDGLASRDATNTINVASAVFISSVIAPLHSHSDQ